MVNVVLIDGAATGMAFTDRPPRYYDLDDAHSGSQISKETQHPNNSSELLQDTLLSSECGNSSDGEWQKARRLRASE